MAIFRALYRSRGVALTKQTSPRRLYEYFVKTLLGFFRGARPTARRYWRNGKWSLTTIRKQRF